MITGCTRSTPSHDVVAEAGLVPVAVRRQSLAARLLAMARTLPAEDLLPRVAEATAPARLKNVTGWRTLGEEMWIVAGISAPIVIYLSMSGPARSRYVFRYLGNRRTDRQAVCGSPFNHELNYFR